MFATFDYLVIDRMEVEEKTPGGIIIPENKKAAHRPYKGRVALAGPECKYVKTDDIVSFDRMGAGGGFDKPGEPIRVPHTETINGRDFTIVSERAVFMVHNEDRELIEEVTESFKPVKIIEEDEEYEEDDGK